MTFLKPDSSAVVTTVLCLVFATGCAHSIGFQRGLAASSDVIQAWIEMGPGPVNIARTIMRSDTCPQLIVDGVSVPMQIRSRSISGTFPVTVCELDLPPGAAQATLGGQELPLPKKDPGRILVIGDTGCRIKAKPGGGTQVQNCNDANSHWPFGQVAQAAATLKPDLVVHVGDYHYREAACPAGEPKCSGAVSGDVWDSWNQDFFTPATPLLSAAPWIFARGNHESCDRAGAGFFKFLDPRPLASGCSDVTSPYIIQAGRVQFAVLDSSKADISNADMGSLAVLPLNQAWLITHRPVWVPATGSVPALATPVNIPGTDDDGDDDDAETPLVAGSALVGVRPGLSLVIAGHRHLFRATNYKDGRPSQLIAGNGGTLLEGHPPLETIGTSVDGTQISGVSMIDEFGFLLFERKTPSTWAMTVYDKNGSAKLKCQLLQAAGTTQAAGRISVLCPSS